MLDVRQQGQQQAVHKHKSRCSDLRFRCRQRSNRPVCQYHELQSSIEGDQTLMYRQHHLDYGLRALTNLIRRREFSTVFRGSLFSHSSLCGTRIKNKADGTIDSTTFSNKTVKSNLPEAEGPKSVSGRTFSEELASIALVAELSVHLVDGKSRFTTSSYK